MQLSIYQLKDTHKTAKYTNLAAQNVNKGINYADKTIRKYPKSASAVGGAIAFDIFDDD
jgi:hypothetical protein